MARKISKNYKAVIQRYNSGSLQKSADWLRASLPREEKMNDVSTSKKMKRFSNDSDSELEPAQTLCHSPYDLDDHESDADDVLQFDESDHDIIYSSDN